MKQGDPATQRAATTARGATREKSARNAADRDVENGAVEEREGSGREAVRRAP